MEEGTEEGKYQDLIEEMLREGNVDEGDEVVLDKITRL